VIDVGCDLPFDVFLNISRISDIGAPTFIIHGTKDRIVPFNHGETLHKALPRDYQYPPFWAEGMGHNNIELDMSAIFIKRLQRFFLTLLKTHSRNTKLKNATSFLQNIKPDIVPDVLTDVSSTEERLMSRRSHKSRGRSRRNRSKDCKKRNNDDVGNDGGSERSEGVVVPTTPTSTRNSRKGSETKSRKSRSRSSKRKDFEDDDLSYDETVDDGTALLRRERNEFKISRRHLYQKRKTTPPVLQPDNEKKENSRRDYTNERDELENMVIVERERSKSNTYKDNPIEDSPNYISTKEKTKVKKDRYSNKDENDKIRRSKVKQSRRSKSRSNEREVKQSSRDELILDDEYEQRSPTS